MLRVLNLSFCNIGDDGAIGLFKGMIKNNVLNEIKLR